MNLPNPPSTRKEQTRAKQRQIFPAAENEHKKKVGYGCCLVTDEFSLQFVFRSKNQYSSRCLLRKPLGCSFLCQHWTLVCRRCAVDRSFRNCFQHHYHASPFGRFCCIPNQAYNCKPFSGRVGKVLDKALDKALDMELFLGRVDRVWGRVDRGLLQ